MSKTRYLQQLGHSWYLRVKVPPALQARVRNTHIRRALGTRDLDEANRRKWPALAHVRAYLDGLRSGNTPSLASVAIAPPNVPPITTPIAMSTATLRAHGGLDALSEDWATTSKLKTVQYQRRQAYAELRAYLGRNCSPDHVTDALAAAYVDEQLSQSRDSVSTRRRKLSALRAFWEWMASRRYLPRRTNPWQGFRLREGETGTKPSKRPYTMAELVTLFSGEPTYPALREVMALGLFTGARINELCSLTQGDLTIHRRTALVCIAKSKTTAGVRTIAVAHPIAFAILKARHRKGAPASSQLFHELKGGGYDQKLSWHVGQAFRYHRNGRGLGGATDFHSLRRTFVTQLENLSVDQVRIARYVGHSLPTLAFKLYSGGATEKTQYATGRSIKYPRDVEDAVKNFLSGCR
jgi:integrase